MKITQTINTQSTQLKNGLTTDQVSRAKELFKEFPLTAICKEGEIEYSTVINVLRGESPKIALLHKALAIVQKKKKQKNKLLSTLPLQ